MESEELNLSQMLKNLYKRRNLLWKILAVAMIIALVYAIIADIWVRTTTAEVLIDSTDASLTDTLSGLDNSKVTTTFDKTKKTITFTASGVIRVDSEENVEEQMETVREKLTELYNIKTYKTLQEIKTETVDFKGIIKDIIIFEAIGLVIYLGYVFVITSWSSTTDSYAMYKLTNLKVLGKVRKIQTNGVAKNKLAKKIDNYYSENITSIEEQIRVIRTNIDLNRKIKEPKTIMFTGADKKVTNIEVMDLLAKEYAKNNKVIVLSQNVDEFKNNNEIYTAMNISNDNTTKEEAIVTLNELKGKFDILLIDGNTLRNNYKALVYANIVDSNIIVALAEKTKVENIIKTKQYIEDVDGKISGIILY